MTTPTPPAVSEAMREAVLDILRKPPLANTPNSTRDLICGVLASEIARLTGERDAAREDCAKFFAVSVRAGDSNAIYLARAEAAEAETARLRAALADVEGKCDLARAVYATEEAATPCFVSGAFTVVRDFARAALTSQEQADA